MLLRRGWREFILNSTMSGYASRKVVGREGVPYYIRLIINLESISGNLCT